MGPRKGTNIWPDGLPGHLRTPLHGFKGNFATSRRKVGVRGLGLCASLPCVMEVMEIKQTCKVAARKQVAISMLDALFDPGEPQNFRSLCCCSESGSINDVFKCIRSSLVNGMVPMIWGRIALARMSVPFL
jgi:hypothetical protein